MKKAFVFLVVVALLGALGGAVYFKVVEKLSAKGKPKGGKAAVAVEVKPLTTASIRDVATFSGTLLPQAQFVVAPKVAGRLEKLLVDVGDTVTRGQLVAVVDSEEFVQQVECARAELEVAKARVAEAAEEQRRGLLQRLDTRI